MYLNHSKRTIDMNRLLAVFFSLRGTRLRGRVTCSLGFRSWRSRLTLGSLLLFQLTLLVLDNEQLLALVLLLALLVLVQHLLLLGHLLLVLLLQHLKLLHLVVVAPFLFVLFVCFFFQRKVSKRPTQTHRKKNTRPETPRTSRIQSRFRPTGANQ